MSNNINVSDLFKEFNQLTEKQRIDLISKFCEFGLRTFVKLAISQHVNWGMMIAAEYGQLEVFELLYNDNPNAFSKEKYIRCMELACTKGHANIVEFLIKTVGVGIDVNCDVKKFHKTTTISPLILACEHNHSNVVSCLLENGATVSFEGNEFHPSPFGWAIRNGNKAIMEALLQTVNEVPVHLIHLATYYGRIDILEILIEKCNDSIDFNDLIKKGISSDRGDAYLAVEWLLKKAHVQYDYKELAEYAANMKNRKVGDILERYGATNYLRIEDERVRALYASDWISDWE